MESGLSDVRSCSGSALSVSHLFGVHEVSILMSLGKTTNKEIYKRSIADSEKYNEENLKRVTVLGGSSFRVGS